MAKPRAEPTTDPTLQQIRSQKLGSKIARRLGITRQAISLWQEVPWNRVLVVSDVTGRPPYLIRPDIYPPPVAAPGGAAPGAARSDPAPLAPDIATSKRSAPRPAKPEGRNRKVTLA